MSDSSRPLNALLRAPSSVKSAIRLPLRVLGLEAPLHATARVLREEGWLRSYREGRPVTREGDPIPWYTYAAIDFLDERLPRDAKVFEFGAGNSTLWYAKRSARVVAIDPNREWVDRLRPQLPANAEVHHRVERAEWLDALTEPGERFDVIAIDAKFRTPSSVAALEHLSERGVIVWDNSRLPEFAELMQSTFSPAGFRSLPFGGLVPIVPSFDQTSVLYRPGNCLGI